MKEEKQPQINIEYGQEDLKKILSELIEEEYIKEITSNEK